MIYYCHECGEEKHKDDMVRCLDCLHIVCIACWPHHECDWLDEEDDE